MPAVPLVAGGVSAWMGGSALLAGATGLGALAAGASLLGGAAMVLGTLKGGSEGAKWTKHGGFAALAGGLGGMAMQSSTAGMFGVPKAGVTPGVGVDAAVNTPASSASAASPLNAGDKVTWVNKGAGQVPQITTQAGTPFASGYTHTNMAGEVFNAAGNPLNAGTTAGLTNNQLMLGMVGGQVAAGVGGAMIQGDAAKAEREAVQNWRNATQFKGSGANYGVNYGA